MKPALLLVLALVLVAGGLALLLSDGSPRPAHSSGPELPQVESASLPRESQSVVDPPSAATRKREVNPSREVARPQPTAQPNRQPTAESEPDRFAFTMKLTGSVVGELGLLSGAKVEYVEEGRDNQGTITGGQGAFELLIDRPSDAGRIRASAPGHAPLEVGITRPAQMRHVGHLRLGRGAHLRGRVLDGAGRPVPGAKVRCTPAAATNLHVHETVAAADGRFELINVPEERIRVVATAPDHGAATQDILRVSGEELELVLGASLHLGIRVQDTSGQPISGVLVRAQATTGGIDARHGHTDDKGELRFEAVQASLWDVSVNDPSYRPYLRTAAKAGHPELVIVLAAWPCVTGRLFAPGGAPAPEESRLQVLPHGLRGDVARRGGGDSHPIDGADFRICGIRPGNYVLLAEAPGFAPTTSDPFQVSHQGDLDLGVVLLETAAELEIVVMNAEGKPAQAEVELYAAPPPPTLWWAERPAGGRSAMTSRTTDVEGSVHFRELARGQVWALVLEPDHLPHLEGPLQVVPGQKRKPRAIRLSVGGTVTGSVKSKAGDALTGALVLILSKGSPGASIQLRTDNRGRYTSPHLTPGTWTVRARYVSENFHPEPGPPVDLVVVAGKEESLDLEL